MIMISPILIVVFFLLHSFLLFYCAKQLCEKFYKSRKAFNYFWKSVDELLERVLAKWPRAEKY